MNPLRWFTRKPIELSDAVASAGTSQVTRDSEAWMSPWFVPRNRYQRLDLYRKAFEEVALLNQGIDALTLLSNGNLLGASGDSAVDDFVIRLLGELNFSQVLDRSLRQFYTYGFSLDEIVWDSSFRNIVRIKPVDSRTVYIRKDNFGAIDSYLQIPPVLFILDNRTPSDKVPHAIKIPTERVIYCTRSPLGDNAYGTSILQPLLQSGLPRTLQLMEKSKGIIYQRMAALPMHFNFSPREKDRFTRKEAEQVMTELKKAVGKRAFDQDIFTAGPISNTPLFQFGGKDLSKDQQFVLEQIMSGMQLVPELFGYSFGQAQSQTREKLAIMIDRIERVRKQREHAINTVLMPAIANTYNLTTMPKIRFEHPRIVDAKIDAEKFSIWIVYIQQILRMGLINGEQAAKMLELPNVFDESKLEEWLQQSTESPQPTNEISKNQVSESDAVIEE
jgi:hypothetical protein